MCWRKTPSLSFLNQFNSNKRTSWLSDVCKKMCEKPLGGAKYFLKFTDDKTHYSWVYPLKTKDQVFDCFLEWKTLVEKSSGKKLKTFCTDNGGEYTSTRFEDYLKSEGIMSWIHHPQDTWTKWFCWKINQTLVESAHLMLLDAKVSHNFWAEAISTAVYLWNRCPTKAVNGMTPYEAWHGCKPKGKHLRVFCCNAYAHVPKDERSKLDSNAYMERKQKGTGCLIQYKGKYYTVVICQIQRKWNSEVTSNDDSSRHLILDFSNGHEPETSTPDQRTPEPELRRSTRERCPPNYYGMEQSHLKEVRKQPMSVEEATTCPESSKWTQMMETEIKSLKDNNVWEFVRLPAGEKAVESKWVYKIKTGADGMAECYKARLVAQGFTQKYGSVDETFCPVVRQEFLRVL